MSLYFQVFSTAETAETQYKTNCWEETWNKWYTKVLQSDAQLTSSVWATHFDGKPTSFWRTHAPEKKQFIAVQPVCYSWAIKHRAFKLPFLMTVKKIYSPMENTHFFTLTSATPYINSKQHPPETPSTYTHLTNSTYQQLPENPTCLLYEYNGLSVKSL